MTNFTFNFDSRDSYVAYVVNWRIEYSIASDEIRRIKSDMRIAYQKGHETSGLQSSLHYARRDANRLMLERTAATEFKNEQLAKLATAA